MVLAQGETVSASNAPIIPKKQLLIGGNRLRIMAPLAVERTPLQKDGRADPWTVIHGETLYVENEPLHSDDCKTMRKSV
jgi:hypothetical protein